MIIKPTRHKAPISMYVCMYVPRVWYDCDCDYDLIVKSICVLINLPVSFLTSSYIEECIWMLVSLEYIQLDYARINLCASAYYCPHRPGSHYIWPQLTNMSVSLMKNLAWILFNFDPPWDGCTKSICVFIMFPVLLFCCRRFQSF
jgi:hypothetical protein